MRPASSDTPLRAGAGGVRLAVRLTPRARANRLDGVSRLAAGAAILKVSVSAPPAEGRANAALLALLAAEWGLPRRDLTITGGHKSRNKIVLIAGEPAALLARLGAALAGLPRP